MCREDRRRYFIVGSVILEVVTPLFWKRIEHDYTNSGLASLQDFLNKQSTKHTIFHLRHRNTWCCKDKTNCSSNGALPLNYCQWDLLYIETNPGVNAHGCHCTFSANPVQLDNPYITLASLILLNCCTLTPGEKAAIQKLRQYKNDYLSHNIKGAITKGEYKTLWADLTNCILQLDPSKQDDMTRIEARPLDEALCTRYCVDLLDIHKRIDEIDDTMKMMNKSVHGTLQNMGSSVQGSLHNMETSILGTLNNIDISLQELLFYARRGMACKCFTERNDNHVLVSSKLIPPSFKYQEKGSVNVSLESPKVRVFLIKRKYHRLGQCKFTIYLVMMDDARLVICFPFECRLLICNSDGSHIDSIHLQGSPCYVTAVNITTVAVTLENISCIEMYDINSKLKLKSISVHEMCYKGITTMNKNLVVCGANRLLFIYHHTGEVVKTTQTDCYPLMLYNSGDRIFYSSVDVEDSKLYWYSFTDDKHQYMTFPSKPSWMTTLQDGSMYVLCTDGSVIHVSSDWERYGDVPGLCLGNDNVVISYNGKQKKLVTINKGQRFARGLVVQIFKEI